MMKIERVSATNYEQTIQPRNIFLTASFAELNHHKVNDIHYLVFSDSRTRLGIILGETDSALHSPFSAPYGGFCQHHTQRLQHIDNAIELLGDYARQIGKKVEIALPPSVYDETFISMQLSAFQRSGHILPADLSYHFQLSDFDFYDRVIGVKAKQKLRHSLREDFVFSKAETPLEKQRAYEVIRQNREEKGYLLRMSWEEIKKTTALVESDFFLLSHSGRDVASAMVFHVEPDIYQLIYWGNINDSASLRPMNLLAYRLFEYYSHTSLKILDIGPSTTDGIPNYGLIDFKESVGCRPSPKFHFEL